MGKLSSLLIAVFLMLGHLVFPSSAAGDPVRVTVTFDVVGSPADPDFGPSTGHGVFSFVTSEVPGTDVLRPEGFGLETMAFTWTGVDWDTTNSDVYRIGREFDGRVFSFTVSGTPAGMDLSPTTPDFRLAFCVGNVPPFFSDGCSNFTFEYSTLRSTMLGTFTGFVPVLSVTREPLEAPVPEPMTVLLVASGLAAMAARGRFRGRGNGADR